MEGVINPECKPADMVLLNRFGDERWYIAYLSDLELGEGWIAVTGYTLEEGKYVPWTCGLLLEHQCERLGLLW